MEVINLGNRIVNNYIFPIKDGYMLIDTGYENNFSAFCTRLEKSKIRINDITYIFLTHAHDDHAGFLNELLHHNTTAKIILHSKAVEGLRRGQNSFDGGCSTKLALFFCKAMALVDKEEHRFPPVEHDFEKMITINLNNPIEIRNAGMQALEKTLGHVGMVKFIQQFDPGYGNYTAEKNETTDMSLDEIDALLAP